jgi:hypothetical protein
MLITLDPNQPIDPGFHVPDPGFQPIDPGMTPPNPGPADLGQTVKDVFGAISDAANGGAHTPADIGQVFGDISKLISDEASQGHTGDSKVVSGDVDHTVKDFFQAISDAGKGGEHAFDGLGKVAGDLGKLLNDLEHDGHQAGGEPVIKPFHDHSNGTDQPQFGHAEPNGMDPLYQPQFGHANGSDAHMHDAHVVHH